MSRGYGVTKMFDSRQVVCLLYLFCFSTIICDTNLAELDDVKYIPPLEGC